MFSYTTADLNGCRMPSNSTSEDSEKHAEQHTAMNLCQKTGQNVVALCHGWAFVFYFSD